MNYLTGQTYIRAPRKTRGRYMTEKRREIKRRYQQIAVASFILGFITTLVIKGGIVRASSAVKNVVVESPTVLRAGSPSEELPKKLTLRIEIKNYICKKFGKDCERALAVAKCESGFNPEAIGVNTNKTVDRGVFQLNTVHYHITSACAFDARCNIDTAYELFKKQGWRPWVCAKKV